jgi:hypothetical protein
MSARRGVATRLPLLLAASCAALAAIVVSEALQPDADPASAPSAGIGKPAALPPLPPDPEFAMPPEASFAVVVDRPVFSPSRRAVQGAAAMSAPGTSGDLKLVGVIIHDDERIALVKLHNGDQLESLRQGDNLAGWSAVSIAPDRVLFRHGGVEEEIILDYKAPAPPVPPRVKRKLAAVPPQPAPGAAMPPGGQPQPPADGQSAAPQPDPAAP